VTAIPPPRMPRPPRTSKRVLRELDRLSRGAHRFHRYAHHPLCTRYAGEVVRIGKVRLCRGCTFAVAGGLAGGCIGLAIGPSVIASASTALGGATLLLATLWLRRRFSKLVTRLAPAGLFALAITCGVLDGSLLGIACAIGSAVLVGGLRLLYGRRGADRTPCKTCPERELAPCSGFAPIVSRERAFQRIAGRRLAVLR
jgi:hypothetical protein